MTLARIRISGQASNFTELLFKSQLETYQKCHREIIFPPTHRANASLISYLSISDINLLAVAKIDPSLAKNNMPALADLFLTSCPSFHCKLNMQVRMESLKGVAKHNQGVGCKNSPPSVTLLAHHTDVKHVRI